MLNRRVVLGGVSTLLGQAFLNAQKHGRSKVVFEHDLPDVTLKDWAVTAVEVSIPRVKARLQHRHPGITIVYVLEGEIRSKQRAHSRIYEKLQVHSKSEACHGSRSSA